MSVKCADCYPNYLNAIIAIAEDWLEFIKRDPPPTQAEYDAKLKERDDAEKAAWDAYQDCLNTCIP